MMVAVLHGKRILSLEEDNEIRNSICQLLARDGYSVDSTAHEDEAVEMIHTRHPDLILVSLAGSPKQLLATAQRMRLKGGLTAETPIVIFSLISVPEGAEMEVEANIYITAPDNFNQLRALLKRVLFRAYPTH
jgi:DNA-binding response OmpR family regulator